MEAKINADDLEPSEDYTLMLFEGRPFTGIAYEKNASGELISEVSYQDGERSGLTRAWGTTGSLVLEQLFEFDVLHGESRVWYGDGALRSAGQFELGICLSEVEYGQQGEVIKEFRLREDSPQFGTLVRLRKLARNREGSGLGLKSEPLT